jgi:hypothetical protein
MYYWLCGADNNVRSLFAVECGSAFREDLSENSVMGKIYGPKRDEVRGRRKKTAFWGACQYHSSFQKPVDGPFGSKHVARYEQNIVSRSICSCIWRCSRSLAMNYVV